MFRVFWLYFPIFDFEELGFGRTTERQAIERKERKERSNKARTELEK